MTQVTEKGLKLAQQITRKVEPPYELQQVCSLICRHAMSVHRVSEAMCNGHPAMSSPYIDIKTASRLQENHDAWCKKRDEQLTQRIVELAKKIPGCKGAIVGGDPRGAPVKLVMRNRRLHNDWGGEGLAVPY